MTGDDDRRGLTQDALRVVLSTYGLELARNPSQLGAVLSDVLGREATRCRHEIAALVAAAEHGVPGRLQAPGGADRRGLADELGRAGVEPQAATWAVGAWARALGIADPEPGPRRGPLVARAPWLVAGLAGLVVLAAGAAALVDDDPPPTTTTTTDDGGTTGTGGGGTTGTGGGGTTGAGGGGATGAATLAAFFPGVDFSLCEAIDGTISGAAAIESARCRYAQGSIIVDFHNLAGAGALVDDEAFWLQHASDDQRWDSEQAQDVGRYLRVDLPGDPDGRPALYWSYDADKYSALAYPADDATTLADIEAWWADAGGLDGV